MIKTYKVLKYPVLNKWHFVFALSTNWMRRGGRIFQFGLFKIIQYPPIGEMINKKCYKGFWLKWEFDLPIFGFSYNFGEQKVEKEII